MLRFRFILLAAAFLAVSPLILGAQTEAPASKTSGKVTIVPFRAGNIYSAELCRQKPSFSVESPFDQPAIENPVWVELIVKLDSGRTLSRFDYELVGKNGTYPCFAVAEGAEGYSSDPEKWIIKTSTAMKYYRMLFPVSQSEIAAAKNELLLVSLKLKLYETTLPPADFKVRVMPEGKSFTRVSSIHPDGLCNLTYHEAFETGH